MGGQVPLLFFNVSEAPTAFHNNGKTTYDIELALAFEETANSPQNQRKE